MSLIYYCFLFTTACFVVYVWTWTKLARSPDWPELTPRLIVSSVCLRQGSRIKIKKIKLKKSRHQLHPATSLSLSQDTEGSEINLAAAPKIEHGPPLEQDAGCVGTSRGHSGQRSYFCSATGPPGVDAHSFIRLPASREGDTHRDTLEKKNAYTPTSSANGRSVGVGRVPFGENLLRWRPELPKFFVTWGYLCLFLCVWVYLYNSSLLVFELKDDGNTPGGSEWPHVSDTLPLCLSLFPWLAVQRIMAIGSCLWFIYAALLCSYIYIYIYIYIYSIYMWFIVSCRHTCTLFAIEKT